MVYSDTWTGYVCPMWTLWGLIFWHKYIVPGNLFIKVSTRCTMTLKRSIGRKEWREISLCLWRSLWTAKRLRPNTLNLGVSLKRLIFQHGSERCQYVFCGWSPKDLETTWFHLNYCSHNDQVRSLHTCEDYLQGLRLCQDLYCWDCKMERDSSLLREKHAIPRSTWDHVNLNFSVLDVT